MYGCGSQGLFFLTTAVIFTSGWIAFSYLVFVPTLQRMIYIKQGWCNVTRIRWIKTTCPSNGNLLQLPVLEGYFIVKPPDEQIKEYSNWNPDGSHALWQRLEGGQVDHRAHANLTTWRAQLVPYMTRRFESKVAEHGDGVLSAPANSIFYDDFMRTCHDGSQSEVHGGYIGFLFKWLKGSIHDRMTSSNKSIINDETYPVGYRCCQYDGLSNRTLYETYKDPGLTDNFIGFFLFYFLFSSSIYALKERGDRPFRDIAWVIWLPMLVLYSPPNILFVGALVMLGISDKGNIKDNCIEVANGGSLCFACKNCLASWADERFGPVGISINPEVSSASSACNTP